MITEYGEGADDRAVSAPSFISKALDTTLRFGGNGEDTRMELAFDAMIGKSADEIAAHMRKLYHGGNGFEIDGWLFSAWYAEDGIYLAGGNRARYASTARVIPWTDAAKRVGELIDAGQFGTELENVEAAGFVRRQVADRLIEMYRDSFAKENGYLPLPAEDGAGRLHPAARSAGVKRDTFPASLYGQQCQPDCQKSERGRRNRRDGHSRREQKTGADAPTDGAAFGKAERTELKRGRSAETPAASPAFFS